MLVQRSPSRANQHIGESGLRLLFANSPVPMYVYDLQTFRFLQVNDAAVSFYGYSHDEFSRMTVFEIRHEESAPPDLHPEMESSHTLWFSGEWRHRRHDGSLVDVEVTRHLVQLSGRDAGLGVVQDISVRKSLERELTAGRAEIKEQLCEAPKPEQLDTRAGRIAHDFNNIVGAILGWSELGAEQTGAHPALYEYFSRIGEQANRAAALTRDLIAITGGKSISRNTVHTIPQPDSQRNSSAHENRETILIAEAEDSARETARAALEHTGYRVLLACDGVSALELFRQNPGVSLVVVDLLMPRVGCHAVVAQMREARPDLPAIFTTGYAAETVAITMPGAQAGRDVVLQKPYESSLLTKHVRDLLDRRRFHEVLDTIAGSVIFRSVEGV